MQVYLRLLQDDRRSFGHIEAKDKHGQDLGNAKANIRDENLGCLRRFL